MHQSTEPGNGTPPAQLGRSGRAGRHHLHPCKRRLTGVSALPHQNPGRSGTRGLGLPKHGRTVQLWPSGSMCQKGNCAHHSPMTTTGTGFRSRSTQNHTKPALLIYARSNPIEQAFIRCQTRRAPLLSSSTFLSRIQRFFFVFCSRSRTISRRPFFPREARGGRDRLAIKRTDGKASLFTTGVHASRAYLPPITR